MPAKAFIVPLAAALAAALSALVGCQSGGTSARPATSELGVSDEAVRCEKCKATFVRVPSHGGAGGKGQTIVYRTEKRDVCPDCKNHVENFFTTGKFQHTCKTCGNEVLERCKGHRM